MRRRTFEEMITYFNQTVSEMDIDRKYKMTLLGIVTALLQKHDEDVAQIVRCFAVLQKGRGRMIEFIGAITEEDLHDKDTIAMIKSQALVRCKDCRYYQDNNGGYPHMNCKWDANETPDEEDFCSGAERLR